MKGKLLVVVQFACLIALIVMPSSHGAPFGRLLVARLCIALAGPIIAVAFVNLRQSVTVFPEPRQGVPLITNGIYGYVRHPMYVAVMLFGAGMALVKWTPLAVFVWLVLCIDLQWKYRYEDRLLAARWPEATLYQASVGALIPRGRHWRT